MAHDNSQDFIINIINDLYKENSEMEDKLEWIYANFTTVENETKWREFEEEFGEEK